MTEEEDRVTLVDEEGKEHDFRVLDGFECDEQEYVVLIPAEADLEAEEVGDAFILRVESDAEGNEVLSDIEDEEEWNRVCGAWEGLQLAEEDEDEYEDEDEEDDEDEFEDEELEEDEFADEDLEEEEEEDEDEDE